MFFEKILADSDLLLRFGFLKPDVVKTLSLDLFGIDAILMILRIRIVPCFYDALTGEKMVSLISIGPWLNLIAQPGDRVSGLLPTWVN